MIKTWPREKFEEDCKSANSCKLMKFLIDTNNDNDDGSYQYVMDFALHELQSRLEQAEKDAARYALSKKHYYIRISGYKGKYRADKGSRVLTDWLDSYDECFDAAMQSTKESQ